MGYFKNYFRNLTIGCRRSIGFTLIEVLVTITIISLLSTIGGIAYVNVMKTGRDTKRKSDIKEIQSALEQYYSTCGSQYPTGAANGFASINCNSPPVAIMPIVPIDPKSTPYYCPTPASDCTANNFKICTKIESDSTTFCVTNQQ
jgi:prepilin-type N-terminal cleavage/methylation domain-containing protein